MSSDNEILLLLDTLIKYSTSDRNTQIAEALKIKVSQKFIDQQILENLLVNEQLGICVIDLNKRVVLFNKAAELITGLSQEKILSKEIDEQFFITSDFFDKVLNELEIKNITHICKQKLNNLNKELYLKMEISKVNDINDKFFALQFSFTDIKSEIDIQVDFEKQKQRFLELLNNSDSMFFIKDEKLRYIYMSPDYLKYNNLTNIEMIGKTDQEVFDIDSARIYTESDLQVLTSREPIFIEGFKDKNQLFNVRKFPLWMNEVIIGLAGIITNVTKNTIMEERLQLLGNAIEQIKEGIIITDKDAKIIYVNKGYTNICGYSKEELLGNTPSLLKSNKMSSDYYSVMWNNLKQGFIWHNVFINKKKNGQIYEEDVIITPVKDSFDNITHYIAIKKDVTEENIHNRAFQHSVKLESLGTLAGGIAHDFNNILSIILGYTELIKEEISDNSHITEDLNEIIKASNRAKEIIRQILLFSRQKESEKSILNVEDVIAGIDKTIKTAVPVNIKLLIYCKTKSHVFMESSHILQILLNLVSNSVQAIKDSSGVISIKIVDVLRMNQSFDIKNKMTYDHYVCIKVVDNGIGISEVDIHKIFDPYFTTKDIGENTGLGLSVIDGIIRSVDGFVDVKSELGKGSEFSIYIPTVKPDKNIIKAKESILSFPKNLRILLVDDESSIVYAITKILNKYGFYVYGFKTSQEAIDYFYKNRNDIDLVITDYLIPGKNGVEIISDIRKVNPAVPCIIISGNLRMMFDEHPDMPKSNIVCIDKPFDSITLLKAIKKIIDKDK